MFKKSTASKMEKQNWVQYELELSIYIHKHKRKHTHSTCIRNMHQKLKRLSTSLFIRKRSIFRIVYINCLFGWFGWPGLVWPGLDSLRPSFPFLSFAFHAWHGAKHSQTHDMRQFLAVLCIVIKMYSIVRWWFGVCVCDVR